MKRCIDQTAQPCNIESIKDDLGEQGWEVITNEELPTECKSVDFKREVNQTRNLAHSNEYNRSHNIFSQSCQATELLNDTNYMTSEMILLQMLRNLEKYPTRAKICRVIELSVTPFVYEQGVDAIRVTISFQLKDLLGAADLIDVKQVVNDVLKEISLEKSQKEFMKELENNLVILFNKLKREEKVRLAKVAEKYQHRIFKEIWERINKIVAQNDELNEENQKLKTEIKEQKGVADPLTTLVNKTKKAEAETRNRYQALIDTLSRKESEILSMQKNYEELQQQSHPAKKNSGSFDAEVKCQELKAEAFSSTHSQQNSNEPQITGSSGLNSLSSSQERVPSPKLGNELKTAQTRQGNEKEKKRSYNYNWRGHIQLQKSIRKLEIVKAK